MTEKGNLPDYEQPASFYLGRKYELAGKRLLDDKVLYDAKDLTTHAMCVGMTGSGKTGLCLALLEEAALDGIPAICLDPKGDLGNLMLAFPELSGADFQPWIEPSEASRKGIELPEYAEQTANKWREGLASWEQQPERIQRYRDSVDMAIYTPASNAGIPMTVLKSFDAPPQEVIDDAEVMRERVAGAASGLLTLMGINADPLTSREHILLANIFDAAWRKGQCLDLPSIIRSIQNPPIDKVGVFDLESFYPANERLKLSMSLNNLLASPGFAGWLEGQPLDIKGLLYTGQGKPRLSIISIAHLNDSERMFFVTILLNELLSWVRTQPGTTTLRALFYMDEVYGYFPPSAKPPSKPPMMVLLKQARAFGLGVVLATQNPVDLDYKGLSNIGTWFLGRLQTARDKDRVLEGLEGAAAQTGMKFDRGAMEQTLAALGSRVFLMNNVHDDAPTIFQSRWAMSFLRGPLSREHIQTLMKDRRQELLPAPAHLKTPASSPHSDSSGGSATPSKLQSHGRPIIPNDIEERFWNVSKRPSQSARLVYLPTLLANVAVHYVRASAKLDFWLDKSLLVWPDPSLPRELWQEAQLLPPGVLELSTEPETDYEYCDVPSEMLNGKQFKTWQKDLVDHLFRSAPLTLVRCVELKTISAPGQDELDARLGWELQLRERRDGEKEKLQAKYAKLQSALESKIRTAEQRLEREKAQYDQEKFKTAISLGQTVVGWLVGSKIGAKSATTGRGVGRAAQQRTDVTLATQTLSELEREKYDLVEQCERDIADLQTQFSVHNLTLEPLEIPCRKGDTRVTLLALLWIPCEIDSNGVQRPLVELQE